MIILMIRIIIIVIIPTLIVCASRHPPRPAGGFETWRVERKLENTKKLLKSMDSGAKRAPRTAKMKPKKR